MITLNPKHRRRLWALLAFVIGLSAAVGLILKGLSDNINLFYTPTELFQTTLPPQTTVRVGGMVLKGSVVRGESLRVSFQITDYDTELGIDYQGILPDLFREGQGVVVQGYLTPEGRFLAKEVLAKHDEKYMPPPMKKIQTKAS